MQCISKVFPLGFCVYTLYNMVSYVYIYIVDHPGLLEAQKTRNDNLHAMLHGIHVPTKKIEVKFEKFT